MFFNSDSHLKILHITVERMFEDGVSKSESFKLVITFNTDIKERFIKEIVAIRGFNNSEFSQLSISITKPMIELEKTYKEIKKISAKHCMVITRYELL